MKRAIELRDIVTSLGPAYIKLGQALSIRPDILSPSAMTELQKLCDKVRLLGDASRAGFVVCLCSFSCRLYLLVVLCRSLHFQTI